MEVIKEAYVIQDIGGTYMCTQNTLTPKLYASRHSAEAAVNYYIDKDKNYLVGYRIKKVFLVLGDDDGN